MEKKKKEFDAVAFVRGVRDEHYRKWGHLPMKEYMKKIHDEAEKTRLAQKFKEKQQNRNK